MSEKDLELKNEQNDSADENAELEEKAAKKFSAEKSYKKSELLWQKSRFGNLAKSSLAEKFLQKLFRKFCGRII